MRIRLPLPLLIVASGVAVVIGLALALTFMDWNLLKGPIERSASIRLGRAVSIAGPLQVRIWTRSPTVTLSGLTVGNPPWDAGPPLLQVERLQVELELAPLLAGHLVFRRVALTRPQIYLHQELSGRANWTFANQAPSSARNSRPPRLPVMRDLLIERGRLVLIDEIRKLKVIGTVAAAAAGSARDPKPFHIEGNGTINAEPFRADIDGGPLRALNPDTPYPFSLAITAGDNHIEAAGKLLKPFDLAAFELQVEATGRDLAELYYLTQITLPNSPPFRIHAQIARHGMTIALRQIAGALGGSDLSGSVDIDASTKRPLVKADLTSHHLLLRDFAAVTGSEARGSHSLAAGRPGAAPANAPAPDSAPRLFPAARLQSARLRAIDADVHFRGTSIEAGSVPLTEVDLHARLADGVLTLQPLRFDFAQGRISSDIRVDGTQQPPRVHADVRASNVQLAQFKGKGPGAMAPLAGVLDGRAVIDGQGDSVRGVLADASGRLTLVIPNGDIESAFAELTGVDVAAGLGLMLRKSNDRTPIRCGAAQFDVASGVAQAQEVDFDTQNVLIKGSGRIYLGSERLDLTIEGHPKKFRLLRVRAPIEVRGQLLRPRFQLEAGHVLKQGALGAALGAVATPLAAVLAFVDPGLARNQDCAQLLAPAAPATHPATPTAAR